VEPLKSFYHEGHEEHEGEGAVRPFRAAGDEYALPAHFIQEVSGVGQDVVEIFLERIIGHN
jgi:hypothetical protein